MKAIIIDDEPKAIELLKLIIQRTDPSVIVIGKSTSIDDAIRLLSQSEPDVVFLDIQLKEGTGFDILKAIDVIKFDVIFTTSYDQYAIEAFKINAIDYLLKPIEEKELERAIKKVKKKESQDSTAILKSLSSIISKSQESSNLIIRERGQMTILKTKDIVFIKADGSYSKIVMKNGNTHISSKNLSHYEKEINNSIFVRTHRSFLMNVREVITYISSEGIAKMSNNEMVFVSDAMKDALVKRLESV